MKLRYKILNTVLALVVLGVIALGITLSYTADCPPPAALPAGDAMNAVIQRCYGSPDVLEYTRIAKPVPKDDQVLVRVHIAAANPLDWHYMRGEPYIMRPDAGIGSPTNPRLGVDFAGTIEAVGKDVRRFKVGDEVFGGGNGSFAEYVVVREERNVVPKPANVTFEEAAAVPIAAITALQALRDKGQVKAGQKVLINGASGGVGTYAVQIAKTLDAQVTGVCSTRNVEMVRSLGADRVVDYKQDDFTKGDARYDVIVDLIGNHGLLALRRVLEPGGRVVIVGGPEGKWIGPLSGIVQALVVNPFVDEEFGFMLADMNPKDLAWLGDQLQAGKLRSVIDRRYELSEVPEALAYLEEGHARGKVVIDVVEPRQATTPEGATPGGAAPASATPGPATPESATPESVTAPPPRT